ncbi:hypothetical protein GCM10007898_33340 [Dyella flagellata]|uniref:Autotransporter domain-containing protein n=2 Tax=Dyella flagellata TaxID=1867833 RepID=A0ABQ5XDN4_9GAMM|nr:hypothetical protein GCM10007898_33340 [Dyella flagellata]
MNGADLPGAGQPTTSVPYYGTQSGAIQALAVDPFNTNLMLAGSPNGGIFRSGDGGKSWSPMIDKMGSLSIGGFNFDLTDPTGMTVVAGIANVSSGATDAYITEFGGVTNQGLLYSSNGGQSWSHIGQGVLPNLSMLNVAARGQVIMAAGFEEEKANTSASGLYRSTDGGKTFARVDQVTGSGLPPGPTSALVADPKDPNRFYVGVTGTSNTAVYTSDDAGKTWSLIFSAANANGAINATTKTMLRLAAGPNGSVAVGIVNTDAGQLASAFLSQNNGKSWSDLSVALAANTISNNGAPSPPGSNPRDGGDDLSNQDALRQQLAQIGEISPGLTVNPGGQAYIHSVLAIDPNHPNVVYLAGDRVGSYGPAGWSAAAMRVALNVDGSITYAPLTDAFTADNSSVHPDCRAMTFDANGDLLMGTDGGVYYRSNPTSVNGVWRGLNYGRQALEIYNLGLDPNTGLIAAAAQDNGAAMQSNINRAVYTTLVTGDGTVATVNGLSTPGYSYTYLSGQYLGQLTRFTTDAKGNFVHTAPWTDSNNKLIANLPVSTDIYFAPDQGNVFKTTQLSWMPANTPTVQVDSTTTLFINPFKLNNIDKSLIATPVQPGVLVAQDNFKVAPTPYTAGDTQCANGCFQVLPSHYAGASGWTNALDFGTHDNTYALLAGSFGKWVWNSNQWSWVMLFASTGTSLNTINLQPVFSYPQAKGAPEAVLFDPRSQNRFFAAAPGYYYLYSTTDGGKTAQDLSVHFPVNFTRPAALGFISSNGVNALLVGGLNNFDNAGNPLVVADSDASGNLSNWRRFGNGLPNAQVKAIDYEARIDAMAIGTFGRGAWMLYDVTSNFADATVLQFGLANNDSNPDAALLFGNRPLIKYGTGTLTINGAASYTGGSTINSGVMLLNGSVLNDVNVASAGVLTGNGSLSGRLNVQGGLVVPGSISGTTLSAGSLSNQGGTLLFGYDPATGQSTKLMVSGAANVGGMTLSLLPLSVAPLNFYRDYNLISATSVSGQFVNASSQSGTSAWVDVNALKPTAGGATPTAMSTQPAELARVDYSSNLMLEMLRPLDWTVGSGNRNQLAVGQALNSLQYSAPSDFLSTLNGVASGNVPANLEAMSGESSVAAVRGINLLGDRFIGTVSTQMNAPGCREDDRDEAICQPLGKELGDHRLWAEAFGLASSLHGEFQSNDFSGGGVALGTEVALGQDAKIGGALGYGHVSTSTPVLSSEVRAHYGMLAVYANYRHAAWFIGGVLSHDDGWSYADRSIHLGAGGVQGVTGKPDSSSTALQVNTGFDFRFTHDWFVQPYANLLAARSSQQAYSEYGAGDLSLAYSGIRQSREQGELGFKLGRTLRFGESMATPYIGLSETTTWGNRQPDAQVSFIDAPATSFVIRGNRMPRAWLSGQAGVRMTLSKSVVLAVSYQGVLHSQLRDDGFNADLSWQF